MNKPIRILLSISLGFIILILGYLSLYGIYATAPTESLEWLSLNPVFNSLIIICFSFSMLTLSIKGPMEIYKQLTYDALVSNSEINTNGDNK